MENNMTTEMTTAQMLESQIQETLEDLELARFDKEETVIRPTLDKLKVLHQQHLELQKLESEIAIKRQQLELEALKLENETKLKVTELELKEREQKQQAELEDKKLKEQKRSNVTNAVIGGVTAATGLAGIVASVSCFRKSLRFEETGSFTNRSSQHVGGIFNLFRRK